MDALGAYPPYGLPMYLLAAIVLLMMLSLLVEKRSPGLLVEPVRRSYVHIREILTRFRLRHSFALKVVGFMLCLVVVVVSIVSSNPSNLIAPKLAALAGFFILLAGWARWRRSATISGSGLRRFLCESVPAFWMACMFTLMHWDPRHSVAGAIGGFVFIYVLWSLLLLHLRESTDDNSTRSE